MANKTKLSGFTLFKVTKGWQMSLRLAEEEGWLVRHVSDEDASRLLDLVGEDPAPINVVASSELVPPPRGRLNLRPARRRVLLD